MRETLPAIRLWNNKDYQLMNYKALFILIAICCLPINIFSQEEIDLYDFCQCDYSYLLKENYTLFNTGEIIVDEGRVVFYRQMNRMKPDLIDFEYIHLSADTFYFLNYNNQGAQLGEIIERGKVYFDRSKWSTDTLEFWELEESEKGGEELIEKTKLIKYFPKIKTGEWYEVESGLQSSGQYLHGQKIGTWNFINWEEFSWKEVSYVDGKVSLEYETNLLKQTEPNNDLAILFLTQDQWYVREKKGKVELFREPPGLKVAFNIDGTAYYKYRSHGAPPKHWNWQVSIKDKALFFGDRQMYLVWFTENYIEGGLKD